MFVLPSTSFSVKQCKEEKESTITLMHLFSTKLHQKGALPKSSLFTKKCKKGYFYLGRKLRQGLIAHVYPIVG